MFITIDITFLFVNAVVVAQISDPICAILVLHERAKVWFVQILADVLTRFTFTERKSLWVDRCQVIIDRANERGGHNGADDAQGCPLVSAARAVGFFDLPRKKDPSGC